LTEEKISNIHSSFSAKTYNENTMNNARSAKSGSVEIIDCSPTSGKSLKQKIPYLMLDFNRS